MNCGEIVRVCAALPFTTSVLLGGRIPSFPRSFPPLSLSENLSFLSFIFHDLNLLLQCKQSWTPSTISQARPMSKLSQPNKGSVSCLLFFCGYIHSLCRSLSRSSLERVFLRYRVLRQAYPSTPMDDLILAHIPGTLLLLQCQILRFHPHLLPTPRTTCPHALLDHPNSARIRTIVAGHLSLPAASRQS